MSNRETIEDLRSWLTWLEEEEHLAHVTERVHWDQELSGIVRRTYDIYGDASPAMLFENIEDYEAPKPNKLFIGQFRSYSRICMMLGLDPVESTRRDIGLVIKERLNTLVPPVTATEAPVHDVVDTGDAINVLKFPVPYFHDRDGGRYVGTMHAVITKDPDSGWVNLGMYRVMVHGPDELGIYFRPGRQHIGLHSLKYLERNEPMPVAIAIGIDPRMTFVAAGNIPATTSEYDIAGSLAGHPMEVVQGKTVDLPVPAKAEIVIEGFVHPDDWKVEGPFGEYPGYYGEVPDPSPVMRVTAVTHREDPIFQASLEGHPVNETHIIGSLMKAGTLWNAFEYNGVPGVKDIACLPESAGGHLVVSITPTVPAHADWIATVAWSHSAVIWSYKHIFVVDDDIDPWDFGQVSWAMAWRVKASEDIKIWKNQRGSPIDPRQEPEAKGYWDRVLIDATRPWHWEPREIWGSEGVNKGEALSYPPTSRPAQSTIDMINAKWDRYAIDPVKKFIGTPGGIMKNWWRDGGE
ncbi:MAG: UbiD family decarboxylase [Rhodospirillales bacterium]|jgi:4-hydroxy-3-polyprenylbenzoate decarboxylase|nr:UbiD family decarboxylase [Rhodospirillales bacterium]